MPEFKKREIAYKLRIGDIHRGKPVLSSSGEPGAREKLDFLELGNMKISRINVVANVIDKFSNEGSGGGTRFATMTLDDASGQISIKAFSENTKLFDDINQGHTVMVIGFLRTFNNEIYILPEIVKVLDPRYLLVRKLELEKSKPKVEVKTEEIHAVKDQIIDRVKKAEQEGSDGIDTEKLVMEIKADPELINQEIKKLLEGGVIYEPRPGVVRFLG